MATALFCRRMDSAASCKACLLQTLPDPARRLSAQAECFYDLGVPDSDEEIELGGYASDVSAMSSLGGSAASEAASGDEAGTAEAAEAASSPASDSGLKERPARAAREEKPKTPKVRTAGELTAEVLVSMAVCNSPATAFRVTISPLGWFGDSATQNLSACSPGAGARSASRPHSAGGRAAGRSGCRWQRSIQVNEYMLCATLLWLSESFS